MKARVYQYLYSVLFVLSTVMSWYYGQVQQYISDDNTSDIEFLTDIHSVKKKTVDSFLFTEKNTAFHYNSSHPRYNKLRANLSESDNDNDDNTESSGSTDLLKIARDEFGHSFADCVTIFHDRKIAISLLNTELLNSPHDDLYLQYRVIRL